MTLEEHYSARGKDYKREIAQKAEEIRYMLDECERLGIPPDALSVNLKTAALADRASASANPQAAASNHRKTES